MSAINHISEPSNDDTFSFNIPIPLIILFILIYAAVDYADLRIPFGGINTWLFFLAAIIGAGSTLRYPVVGLAVTAASLVIVGILPDVPLVSSFVPLIGAGTIGAYLMRTRALKMDIGVVTPIIFLGFGFIAWMSLTYIGYAIDVLPTYIQLLVLMFLAANLIENQQQLILFMIVFCSIVALSAFSSVSTLVNAIQTGSFAQLIEQNTRLAGLALDGQNKTARYFTLGFVFSLGLIQHFLHRENWKMVIFGAITMVLAMIAALATGSRSALVLLVFSLVFFFIQLILNSDEEFSLKSRSGQIMIGLVSIAIILVINTEFALLLDGIFARFSDTVTESDTSITLENIRLSLWSAGLDMWRDHPIRGIGIAQFDNRLDYQLRYISQIGYRGLNAHNTYISVLAETGMIGFILFMTMNVIAVRSFLYSYQNTTMSKPLVWTFFTAYIVMAVGGLFKQDSYERMVWFTIGISQWWILQEQKKQTTEKSKGTRFKKQIDKFETDEYTSLNAPT